MAEQALPSAYSLDSRLEFETQIADLSSRFINLPPDEVDHEIQDALCRVCQLLGIKSNLTLPLSVGGELPVAALGCNLAWGAAVAEGEKSWSFNASVYGYILPDGPDYLQPTVTADRRWLHLEARYNYEAPRTGSFWVGYNFSVGKKLTLDFTPMLGGVLGDTTGIAPGYTGTLSW